MLKDFSESDISSVDFSIAKGRTVDSIVSFLDNKLPLFRGDVGINVKNEDEISQECCIFLAREARNSFFMFHFQHKYLGQNRSSDFSIISAEKFSSKEPLFVIEAKRLPTPGSGRQREYVQGNLGGIERFKRGFHGKSLGNSAMIGYVQRETFEHWFKEINSWINDLVLNSKDSSISWIETDKLKFEKNLDELIKYSSSHSRVKESKINLIHYWIYFK
jgi:hypothetical protein